MKVLLVRPHLILALSRRFNAFLHLEPLDLEIVAGGVEAPHEVEILDLSHGRRPFAALRRKLRAWQPDVVGFGCYSNQARAVRELAGLVRQVLPAAKIVVGGVHASIAPQDLNRPELFDFVVRGEGSVAIRRLAALEAGRPIADEGILPVGKPEFAALAEGPPPAHPDYRDVAKPRRDLVDRSKYFCIWSGKPDEKLATLYPRVASMRTSVGCPRRCSFCVVHFLAHGRYVQREPADVVDEIASISEDYVYFVDDEMFINPVRAEAIARLLIERGIRKQYVSWARSDTICAHPELFKLWQRAGLQVVYVGLESMEADALKGFNKGVDPDTNRRAVAILREAGIVLHSALIVNPDFTKEDFQRLHRTVAAIAPAEMSFTVLAPSPGTDFWNDTRARFIAPDPYAFYDCMHTLLPTRLPMATFYRYFSLLYLRGFQHNPWRAHRVKVPFLDLLRLMLSGARTGWTLHGLHRDYPPEARAACGPAAD
ncbi:MAG TPA: radical SAM protein [Kiritimatiellia bacterium]|nr:radical SAM protein [Kiritimatiellia bacterium]